MKKTLQLLLIALVLNSCTQKQKTKNPIYIKLEIVKTEKDFEKLVAKKGLAEGFYQFADSSAVIKRENDTLITGKDNIRKYYSKQTDATVTWTPEFVSVAEAGDMAYTYGKYRWISKNATGKEHVLEGVFHTVWKKQKDGSWKYVWD